MYTLKICLLHDTTYSVIFLCSHTAILWVTVANGTKKEIHCNDWQILWCVGKRSQGSAKVCNDQQASVRLSRILKGSAGFGVIGGLRPVTLSTASLLRPANAACSFDDCFAICRFAWKTERAEQRQISLTFPLSRRSLMFFPRFCLLLTVLAHLRVIFT